MFLDDEELERLTGYVRHSAQVRWLRSHGWNFEVAASGRPVVSRSYSESKLGGANSAWKPDFSGLR
jgi:hypothetical protein